MSGFTMGTTYNIQLVNVPSDLDRQGLANDIQATLYSLDKELMSTYSEASELSSFNRSTPGQHFEVAPELAEVISIALQVYRQSDHAFDITVGPLVRLWGFGPDGEMLTPPDQTRIDEARELLGSDALSVSLLTSTLHKSRQVELDLSGIAKGYAVDQLALLLREKGLNNFLIEIGGELIVHGNRGAGEAWTLAIDHPVVSDEKHAYQTLSFRGDSVAIAGSGDYRNYFEYEGQRYSHEINPQTGYPIAHNVVSVTVIAQNAAYADALATAFMIIDPDQAFALATGDHLAVYFIMRTEIGYESRYTDAFARYIQDI